MRQLAMHEIFSKLSTFENKEQVDKFLELNKSPALDFVLKCALDENVKWKVPNIRPNWKRNNMKEVHGRFIQEIRRIQNIFINDTYPNLNQTRREQLFIEILESIDDQDAELLCDLIEMRNEDGTLNGKIPQRFQCLF